MKSDVLFWVKSCVKCEARKSPLPSRRASMIPISYGEPMERVGLDFLGPFPITELNNRYVLVVSDYFT